MDAAGSTGQSRQDSAVGGESHGRGAGIADLPAGKNYRDRKGIKSGPADLDKITQERIIKACKKAYQVLELTGHARIDLRLTSEGKIYILEVNPNPNIALDDEFALSALHAQIKYPELIEKLLP